MTQTETRIFHYDLRGHLIAETNQAGQMLAEYIYLGDQLLSMIKPGESVYYYHNDHLGTPQVVTDDSQTIAWKAVYTTFGKAVPSIQTVENPFRFPGQYYDPETGLHYNYFRYYNPQTGRYMTPDPIGLWGGINLFAYTVNSPISRKDLSGLWWDSIDFGNYYYPGMPSYAVGISLEFSTINPFSSGGGGAYGLNWEYTSSTGSHLYKYSTPNDVKSWGFFPGVSLTGNFATGSGDWTGPFGTVAGNYGFLTGALFRSSDAQPDEGYFGISFGGSIPFPYGLGLTRTKYYRLFPEKPCKQLIPVSGR